MAVCAWAHIKGVAVMTAPVTSVFWCHPPCTSARPRNATSAPAANAFSVCPVWRRAAGSCGPSIGCDCPRRNRGGQNPSHDARLVQYAVWRIWPHSAVCSRAVTCARRTRASGRTWVSSRRTKWAGIPNRNRRSLVQAMRRRGSLALSASQVWATAALSQRRVSETKVGLGEACGQTMFRDRGISHLR
jgi:hypothetical protein